MIGICDICRYGQTDKCTNPDRKSLRECFVSHSGTTIAENKIKTDAIDKFIKDVLIELNTLAENDDYYFDKDNANLVSTILYSQFEKLKGNEE